MISVHETFRATNPEWHCIGFILVQKQNLDEVVRKKPGSCSGPGKIKRIVALAVRIALDGGKWTLRKDLIRGIKHRHDVMRM
jgi:hypothetical protein